MIGKNRIAGLLARAAVLAKARRQQTRPAVGKRTWTREEIDRKFGRAIAAVAERQAETQTVR